MNNADTRACVHPAPETPQPVALSHAERAEAQRQGAKAAARGEPEIANPLNRPHNRPSATGEPARLWQQRCTAWKQGHAAQTACARRLRQD